MAHGIRKNSTAMQILWVAGGAAAAYVGYRWWKKKRAAVSAVVAAVTASSSGPSAADAWSAFTRSAIYTAPGAEKPTQERFMAVWPTLSAEQKAAMVRSFSMTMEQIMAAMVSDPAFAAQAMSAGMLMMPPPSGASSELPAQVTEVRTPEGNVVTVVDTSQGPVVTNVKSGSNVETQQQPVVLKGLLGLLT